jgi:hypothetical protein
MSEYGMSLFTSATGINNTIGRTTTQQFPAPAYSDLAWTKAGSDFGSDVVSAEGKLNFSDFLNVFLLNQKYDLGVLIRALQNKGLFQSLAEPNLVAESGKEASFLAGGEFPVPVAQGSGANIGVSVMFKEFGIRLNFTPTVVGDRVHLKVRPEVSTLDYGNAVLLSGFRIPSLSTRRAETELELRNGQTFAIAGLMSNQMQTTMQKIPGIGDIPILGYLFKSKAAKRDQTELVVMITPEILPNTSPGVTPDLPKYPESFMPPLSDLKKSVPPPAPAFVGGSRSLAANPAAAPAADTRTEIERAQDRALAAIDSQNAQPVAAAAAAAAAPAAASPVVAPQAAAPVKAVAPQAAVKAAAPVAPQPQPVAVQPVAAQAPAAQSTDPANVTWKQAEADVAEVSKDQRQAEKAAREQAERDAKVADKARKEEAKRAAAAQAKQAELDREQAKKDAEAAKVQAKKDAEAAKLQAKRDAEAAKVQAQRDAEAAKVQAQRNAELARLQAKQDAEAAKGQAAADAVAQRQTLDAKREAERDAERQRAIDAAAERLRAAEAEYQAELARRTQR